MELSRRLSHGGSGALLILDLDGFKGVNDELGHSAGDQVLMTVAKRINACMRAEDFVARLGGDEFAVALGRITDDGAAAVASKLRSAIAAPMVGQDASTPTVTASIGRAMFVRGGTLDALMQQADREMYAHKRRAATG